MFLTILTNLPPFERFLKQQMWTHRVRQLFNYKWMSPKPVNMNPAKRGFTVQIYGKNQLIPGPCSALAGIQYGMLPHSDTSRCMTPCPPPWRFWSGLKQPTTKSLSCVNTASQLPLFAYPPAHNPCSFVNKETTSPSHTLERNQ